VVWAPRLHGEPGGPTSITGTARFVPATFYIASLPFQDTPPNGGSGSSTRVGHSYGTWCRGQAAPADPDAVPAGY